MQANLIERGYVLNKHMQFQLSKVFSAKLVIFLWFTKNFVKKLSHFLKNSWDLVYALNFYVTVFFQPNNTQKQIKTMNSFLKKDVYFSTLRKKAINKLVFHQLYSKIHTKLLECLSTMVVFVGIQKEINFWPNYAIFCPFLAKKWPFWW